MSKAAFVNLIKQFVKTLQYPLIDFNICRLGNDHEAVSRFVMDQLHRVVSTLQFEKRHLGYALKPAVHKHNPTFGKIGYIQISGLKKEKTWTGCVSAARPTTSHLLNSNYAWGYSRLHCLASASGATFGSWGSVCVGLGRCLLPGHLAFLWSQITWSQTTWTYQKTAAHSN